MINKHDSICNKVERLLQSKGYSTFNHIEYDIKNICGELDVYAKYKNYILLFEIKCNHTEKSYAKAICQLIRAEKYCFPEYRVFKFYVHSDKQNNLNIHWIKTGGNKNGNKSYND